MPGTRLEAQALSEISTLRIDRSCVLLLLSGQVVVDLPRGAFRVLEPGHSLVLPDSTDVTLQPIGGQAILVWTDAG